ncbi:transposon-encoded TnpW family protein [Clostridium sp. AF32-12BH]|uniref:transposon-encoded TnpW family protein n=1 Tax=Clostridium sp. AF32-12BH TaxID=2292006 RepID=UPI00325C03EF
MIANVFTNPYCVYKNRGEHIYKENWQTVYDVRYHFNEDTKETMQEKIKRMPVTEASRMAVY